MALNSWQRWVLEANHIKRRIVEIKELKKGENKKWLKLQDDSIEVEIRSEQECKFLE